MTEGRPAFSKGQENLQFPGQSWLYLSLPLLPFHFIKSASHDASLCEALRFFEKVNTTWVSPSVCWRPFLRRIDCSPSTNRLILLPWGSIFFATTILATYLIPLILNTTIVKCNNNNTSFARAKARRSTWKTEKRSNILISADVIRKLFGEFFCPLL
jgi:hypothetical protein